MVAGIGVVHSLGLHLNLSAKWGITGEEGYVWYFSVNDAKFNMVYAISCSSIFQVCEETFDVVAGIGVVRFLGLHLNLSAEYEEKKSDTDY